MASLDEMAAPTEVAVPDMSAALAGPGAPPPGASDPTGGVRQAQDDTVQRALLGDELTDRYGDVLGLRKETWRDFWRDFGNELGGKGNAERIKQRVIDQYQTREREERLAAQERDQEDRLKLQSFFDLIGKVKTIPKGHRKGILQVGFNKLGMEASPEVLKLIADVENFGQLPEALRDPKVIAMAFENPQKFLADMLPVSDDPEALLAFVNGVMGMQAKRQDIQNKILEGDRKKGIEQRATDRAKRALAERLSTLMVTDEATGEKRRLTPQEILAHIAAIYPDESETGAAPTGIPQEVPPEVAAEVDPMAGATSMSTPTTSVGGATTTPSTAPAGIPQAGAPAAAPAGRLNRITGTVRRVE